MTIPDTEYAVQALAWLVVWSVGGMVVRHWLAGRDNHHNHHHSGQQ